MSVYVHCKWVRWEKLFHLVNNWVVPFDKVVCNPVVWVLVESDIQAGGVQKHLIWKLVQKIEIRVELRVKNFFQRNAMSGFFAVEKNLF